MSKDKERPKAAFHDRDGHVRLDPEEYLMLKRIADRAGELMVNAEESKEELGSVDLDRELLSDLWEAVEEYRSVGDEDILITNTPILLNRLP